MLTEDTNIDRYVDQQLCCFGVAADTRIFRGALVGLNAERYARPLNPGDIFAGIAYEGCDNSGADGECEVTCFTQGDFKFSADTPDGMKHIGQGAFAVDDDDVVVGIAEAARLHGSYIGWVIDVPEPGKITVRIEILKEVA